MKIYPPLSYARFALFAGVLCGCQGQAPSTSSSTNWLTCTSNADCAVAPEAVECLDGYCVDDQGARIPQSSSEETTSSTTGDGGTQDTAGDDQGGTGASDSSGGATSGSGGGAMAVDCNNVDPLAECSQDEDCTTGTRVLDCCGSAWIHGVSIALSDDFQAWAAACSPEETSCECVAPPTTTTDDGRRLVDGDAGSRCVDGLCKSHVATRACGELICGVGEICVDVTTTVGPMTTHEYVCETNPCAGTSSPPSCTCAQSVCDRDDGRSRACSAPWNQAVEVLCEDMAQ